MKNLTKLEILFVRACKSKNPKRRLNSVYRRFYCRNNTPETYITSILSRICEENNLLSVTDLIEKLSISNRWKYSNTDINMNSLTEYSRLILSIMISTIQLTEIKRFPGFISPAIFRHDRF
jgi:hypothetical protein